MFKSGKQYCHIGPGETIEVTEIILRSQQFKDIEKDFVINEIKEGK